MCLLSGHPNFMLSLFWSDPGSCSNSTQAGLPFNPATASRTGSYLACYIALKLTALVMKWCSITA